MALLRYSGRKRRQHSNLPEDEVMLLAMRDMNLAKLTSNDLPLFNGITRDLFPGVETPIVDYSELQQAIEAEMKKVNLQVNFCVQTILVVFLFLNRRFTKIIISVRAENDNQSYSVVRDKNIPTFCYVGWCYEYSENCNVENVKGCYDDFKKSRESKL